MPRGFLSEGSSDRWREDDGNVTVNLELGTQTEKSLGFRDPNRKDKNAGRSGGSREALIWLPKLIRGVPLVWEGGSSGEGRLTAPKWLLTKSGLI